MFNWTFKLTVSMCRGRNARWFPWQCELVHQCSACESYEICQQIHLALSWANGTCWKHVFAMKMHTQHRSYDRWFLCSLLRFMCSCLFVWMCVCVVFCTCERVSIFGIREIKTLKNRITQQRTPHWTHSYSYLQIMLMFNHCCCVRCVLYFVY